LILQKKEAEAGMQMDGWLGCYEDRGERRREEKPIMKAPHRKGL